MIRIFGTKESLDCLIYENKEKKETEQSFWYKILTWQKEIFSDSSNEDLLSGGESLLADFIKDKGIFVHDAREFLSDIKKEPASVLKEPCGVFILDISESEAANIQKKYGVICVSCTNLPTCCLTKEPESIALCEKDQFSWGQILSISNGTPTNFAIITDRFLFQHDKDPWSEVAKNKNFWRSPGLWNVREILRSLLPKDEFIGVFHIVFVYGLNHYHYKLSESLLANSINEIVGGIVGNRYKVECLVVGMKESSLFWGNTHNRRIITNNMLLSAEHKLCAFKYNYGHGRRSERIESPIEQIITVGPLFPSGKKGSRFNEAHSNYICNLQDTFYQWGMGKDRGQFVIFLNGQTKEAAQETIKESNNYLISPVRIKVTDESWCSMYCEEISLFKDETENFAHVGERKCFHVTTKAGYYIEEVSHNDNVVAYEDGKFCFIADLNNIIDVKYKKILPPEIEKYHCDIILPDSFDNYHIGDYEMLEVIADKGYEICSVQHNEEFLVPVESNKYKFIIDKKNDFKVICKKQAIIDLINLDPDYSNDVSQAYDMILGHKTIHNLSEEEILVLRLLIAENPSLIQSCLYKNIPPNDLEKHLHNYLDSALEKLPSPEGKGYVYRRDEDPIILKNYKIKEGCIFDYAPYFTASESDLGCGQERLYLYKVKLCDNTAAKQIYKEIDLNPPEYQVTFKRHTFFKLLGIEYEKEQTVINLEEVEETDNHIK